MTTVLDVFIPGIPAAQGSKRHVGNGRMIEMDKKLPVWRNTIQLVCRHIHKTAPVDKPVRVRAVFYIPRPKRPKFDVPATPADLDKLQRALGDAITGIVIRDDSRIVQWDAEKKFAQPHAPGVHVVVEEA